MSDPVPPQAPPGFKWTKSFLGLFGPWVLVEDPENPLPPPGYRYAINFWTAKKELISVVGEGVNWLDPKDTVSSPKPTVPHPTLLGTIDNPRYIAPQIQPDKIGKSVTQVEGLEEPLSKPLPGSDKYDVKKRDLALFG